MHAQSTSWWRGGPWDRQAHCGGFRHRHGRGGEGAGQEAFGVRRPLRFLAYKLELDDDQVAALARAIEALKLERAQAAVDDRYALAHYAEAVEGDAFEEAKVAEATAVRARSAERVNAAVATALRRIHGILRPEQRARLATLIRTGHVTL